MDIRSIEQGVPALSQGLNAPAAGKMPLSTAICGSWQLSGQPHRPQAGAVRKPRSSRRALCVLDPVGLIANRQAGVAGWTPGCVPKATSETPGAPQPTRDRCFVCDVATGQLEIRYGFPGKPIRIILKRSTCA